MSDVLTIIYKCRRCGVVFRGVSSSRQTIFRDLTALCDGERASRASGFTGFPPPTLLSVHDCKDGGLGIGDLIGAGRSFNEEAP